MAGTIKPHIDLDRLTKVETTVEALSKEVGRVNSLVSTLTIDVGRITNSVDGLTSVVRESNMNLAKEIKEINAKYSDGRKTNWSAIASMAALLLGVLVVYIERNNVPTDLKASQALQEVQRINDRAIDDAEKLGRLQATVEMLKDRTLNKEGSSWY